MEVVRWSQDEMEARRDGGKARWRQDEMEARRDGGKMRWRW